MRKTTTPLFTFLSPSFSLQKASSVHKHTQTYIISPLTHSLIFQKYKYVQKKSAIPCIFMYYEAHSLIDNFLTDKTSECSQLCVVEKLMIVIVTTIISTLIQPEPLLRIIPLHISIKNLLSFLKRCQEGSSANVLCSSHHQCEGALIFL